MIGMKLISSIYTWLIMALAVIAGAMIAGVFLMIIYDVAVRTLGFQPPFFTSALSEYAMLYATLFAAPWVVRTKSHVFVEFLASSLPERTRRVLRKAVYFLCVVICTGLAWYGAQAVADFWSRGELDIRSIVIPRWLLYAPLPLGFGLCAIEFARFFVGFDDMYIRQDGAGIDGI